MPRRRRSDWRDLTGMVFGRLKVIGFDSVRNGSYYWLCECECGNRKSVQYSKLMRGHTRSCGCLASEIRRKHGMSHTRLYNTWTNMKSRCTNPKDEFYKDYGGRGIKVCDEWMKSFSSFYEWAMNNGYADHLTIDRIDNDGDYTPDNCRWVDLKEQANNKRNNVTVTINGLTKTLAEWSEITGIPYKTLHVRYSRGDRGERLIRGVKR